jgi:phasin family protein
MDAVTLACELKKLIDQCNTAGMPVLQLIEARGKDFEALVEATRTRLDDVQSLAAKQTELLRGAVDELSDLLQQVSMPAGPAGARVSAEVLRQTVSTALQSMSELVEFASKSQAKAVDLFTNRVHREVEEWMALLRVTEAPKRGV